MNKRQIAQALTAHKEREAAKRAERLVVAGYPYSHNPYLAHEPVEDCFAGCVRTDGHARFIPASTKDGAK